MNGSALGGRLTRNLFGSLLAKALSSLFRIVMISSFIWFLGANRQGGWLPVSFTPFRLAVSSFSIGSGSANAIAPLAAKGDHREAHGFCSTKNDALAIFVVGGLANAAITESGPQVLINSHARAHAINGIR